MQPMEKKRDRAPEMFVAIKKEKPFINIEGRRRRMSVGVYNTLCMLTLGALYMACRYMPRLKFFVLSTPCALSDADCVILTSQSGKREFIDILVYASADTLLLRRYTRRGLARVIDSQFSRLVYDFAAEKFVVPPVQRVPSADFNHVYEGEVSKSPETERLELAERNIFYGKNITNLPIAQPQDILVRNVLSATCLLNVVCILVWRAIEYMRYGFVMGLVMGCSLVFGIWEELLHAAGMRRLVVERTVKVLRNGGFVETDSREVYPGNIIYIEPCKGFPCDAVVIKGDAITNECLLTGESVPIYKSADQPSVVYSGTDVLKSINATPISANVKNENLCRVRSLTSRSKPKTVDVGSVSSLENFAIGFVLKTGFQTARGQILKNILDPKPVHNRFVEEAETVIWGVIAAALVVGGVMVYVFWRLGLTPRKNLAYGLDLFFTLANPALPTYLRLGTQLCYRKLVARGIQCNSLNKIHLAGCVDTAVFDKTGTLTCEGLDLLCIDNLGDAVDSVGQVDLVTRMGLSTCHLVYELDGKYSGDTLDVKMFMFSSSRLVQHADNTRSVVMGRYEGYGPILKEYNDNEEMVYYQKSREKSDFGSTDDEYVETVALERESGSEDETGIEIVKTYEFDSSLRRMSVVADDGVKRYVFTKGSPESILGILQEQPRDYEEKTRAYSLDGYRVISLAYKEVSESVDRATDEAGLTFLALIVFSNKLKPDSKATIEELDRANIRNMMCTGDNILTAISVGKECGIIRDFVPVIFPVLEENAKSVFDVDWLCIGDDEEFTFDKVKLSLYRGNDRASHNEFVVACEGKEFDFFRNTQYFQFILEKGTIFARFNPGQKKALVENLRANGRVTMFCGDGANDSGALSSADVGLALAQNEASLAASFASSEIGAAVDLIREGRSALVTSVATFRYVVSSCVIAYMALFFLVLRRNFLSDLQTLHSDMLVMLPVAYFMTAFDAADRIHPRRPDSFLLGKRDLVPLCSAVGLEGVVIACLSRYGEESTELCDNAPSAQLVFFAIAFMYVLNGIYLSRCFPHRQSTGSNGLFKGAMVLLLASTTCLMGVVYLFPQWSAEWLEAYRFNEFGTRELCISGGAVVATAVAVFVVQPMVRSVLRGG